MTNQDYARDRFAPTTMTRSDPDVATVPEPAALDCTVPRTVVVPGEVVASSLEERPRPTSRIEVDRGGTIQIRDDESAAREAVSEVTTDTFYVCVRSEITAPGSGGTRLSLLTDMTMTVNLDAIAEAVRAAQRNDGQPVDPSKRVYVGREGQLLQGNEATGGERIAEVTGDTFYAQSRHGTESAFVRSNMPQNTMRVSDGTYDGWHFTITNEFGDSYSLFLYYHAGFGVYRVALIEPRMGGTVDAHGGHLWPDGTLCLTHRTGSGYPSMGATYAKAALWTRGASCYRRGYGFQFNVGQD